MKKNTYSGLFIAFEGLDGSGSRIQASLLSGVLKKEGYRVRLTKEPTYGLIGGLIKAQITGEWKADQKCLQLLFAADRAKHLEDEIIPNLENGNIVITDRYVFSTVAYGSVGQENAGWLECVNSEFILPDIVFLVKVSPKICAMRLRKSKKQIVLFPDEAKLKKVWKVYEDLAKRYNNIYVIDGERDEMEIMDEIIKITNKKLGISKR